MDAAKQKLSVVCRECSRSRCEKCERDNCLCALIHHGMARNPK